MLSCSCLYNRENSPIDEVENIHLGHRLVSVREQTWQPLCHTSRDFLTFFHTPRLRPVKSHEKKFPSCEKNNVTPAYTRRTNGNCRVNKAVSTFKYSSSSSLLELNIAIYNHDIF